MSIYKYKSGYRLDFRAHAPSRGEKPIRISRVFSTKAEAQQAQRQLEIQLERARRRGRVMPDFGMTLKDVIRQWEIESKEASKLERLHAKLDSQQETSRRRKWAESHLGTGRFVDINFVRLDDYVQDMREDERAESTIRNDLFILSRLFKYVRQKWRWEIENPVPEVLENVTVGNNTRNRRISADDYERILGVFEQIENAQKDLDHPHQRKRIEITTDRGHRIDIQTHPSLLHIRPAFLAALECGMRRTKMFEMDWSWVDWKSRDIVVPDQRQGPKNKGVPSRVPMSPRLHDVLKKLYGPRRIGKACEEKIFGRLNGDRAYRLLKTVCAALEIEDFYWHDLRHEACSRLADRGWSIAQIQAVSGHKTLTALQRYIKVSTQATHALFERDENESKTGTYY